jgi:hypothetical protein
MTTRSHLAYPNITALDEAVPHSVDVLAAQHGAELLEPGRRAVERGSRPRWTSRAHGHSSARSGRLPNSSAAHTGQCSGDRVGRTKAATKPAFSCRRLRECWGTVMHFEHSTALTGRPPRALVAYDGR